MREMDGMGVERGRERERGRWTGERDDALDKDKGKGVWSEEL